MQNNFICRVILDLISMIYKVYIALGIYPSVIFNWDIYEHVDYCVSITEDFYQQFFLKMQTLSMRPLLNMHFAYSSPDLIAIVCPQLHTGNLSVLCLIVAPQLQHLSVILLFIFNSPLFFGCCYYLLI